MRDFRIELFSARQKRAAVVALAGVLVIAAAAGHELAPARTSSVPAAAKATPLATPPSLSVWSYAPESASAVTVAAGNDFASAQLYRTVDGGRSWRPVHLPAGADHATNVSLVPGTSDLLLWSSSSAFPGGRGNAGRAWRSRDHGAHWTELVPPDPVTSGAPRFLDSTHGYWTAASPGGLHVYSTADGGRTWQDAIDVPATAHEIAGTPIPGSRTVAFAASTPQIAWLVVTPRAADANGFALPTGMPLLFRSGDGWRTWQPVSLAVPSAIPDGAYLNVPPPQIGRDGRGFLVMVTLQPAGGRSVSPSGSFVVPSGGVFASFARGAEVAWTRDGGLTWSPPHPLEHAALQLGPDGLLLSPEGSSLAVSSDLGSNWTVVNGKLPAGGSLVQVSMLTSKVGWSVDGRLGETRGLLRTLDGGRNWTRVATPTR